MISSDWNSRPSSSIGPGGRRFIAIVRSKAAPPESRRGRVPGTKTCDRSGKHLPVDPESMSLFPDFRHASGDLIGFEGLGP